MNPNDFFESMVFSWTDVNPSTIAYTLEALSPNGITYSVSSNYPKFLPVDSISVRDDLVNKLINIVMLNVKKHAKEAFFEFTDNIKKKDIETQKLAMQAPFAPDPELMKIIHHTTQTNVQEYVAGIDPTNPIANKGQYSADVVSIFDKKKNPKFVPAPGHIFSNDEMQKLLLDMVDPGKLHGTKTSHQPDMLETAKNIFPGLEAIIKHCPMKRKVFNPEGERCECPGNLPLHSRIINLNDSHGWSREKIAEWLDTLDIDLSVPIKREQVNAEN